MTFSPPKQTLKGSPTFQQHLPPPGSYLFNLCIQFVWVQVSWCRCTNVVLRGLYGAEHRGACWAAELRERVWDGWQGGWTQLLLFLQAPAEGDTHTHVKALADQWKTNITVHILCDSVWSFVFLDQEVHIYLTWKVSHWTVRSCNNKQSTIYVILLKF